MSQENQSSEDKTEAPTPRRRKQARDEGKIARSPELAAAALLLTGTGILSVSGGGGLGSFVSEMFRVSASRLSSDPMTAAGALDLLRRMGAGMLLALLPLLAGIVVVATFAGLVQTRGGVSFQVLEPKLSRLNPLSGLRKIFGLDAVVTLVKAVAKIAVLAAITYAVLSHAWPQFVRLAESGPVAVLATMRSEVLRLTIATGIAFLAIAMLDYGVALYRHEKSLKMTRPEVVREHRENEGDPLMKSRIQALGRSRARHRMMQQVATADVVIVNPTHIAIALRYDISVAAAPVVVAMGERKLAERIKALALKSKVTIVENKPVARALLATAVVGRPIPSALYTAVAEILAYVYRRRAGLPALLPRIAGDLR